MLKRDFSRVKVEKGEARPASSLDPSIQKTRGLLFLYKSVESCCDTLANKGVESRNCQLKCLKKCLGGRSNVTEAVVLTDSMDGCLSSKVPLSMEQRLNGSHVWMVIRTGG
ncbi:unnamed protein product [Rhodiola kirilowii]